jgi:hypothetical protein
MCRYKPFSVLPTLLRVSSTFTLTISLRRKECPIFNRFSSFGSSNQCERNYCTTIGIAMPSLIPLGTLSELIGMILNKI